MQVRLLGTGAADGWPTAYCRCPSCRSARTSGRLRTPTSALVDDRLLLDLGPEAARQALRAGTDLADVQAVLVTHVHGDHFDPAALLYRSWSNRAPLTIVGPAPVIAAARPWLAPGQESVTLVPVTSGDRLTVAGYDVRVLPADHHAFGECVLYDVTDPAGARLLYATDTGPWEQTFAELAGAELDHAAAHPVRADYGSAHRAWAGEAVEPSGVAHPAASTYGLVLLEETFGERPAERGHHDLASFARAVGALRDWGLADRGTRVVAVHLSHFNPPDLDERLAPLGVEVLDDLALLDVHRVDPATPAGP